MNEIVEKSFHNYVDAEVVHIRPKHGGGGVMTTTETKHHHPGARAGYRFDPHAHSFVSRPGAAADREGHSGLAGGGHRLPESPQRLDHQTAGRFVQARPVRRLFSRRAMPVGVGAGPAPGQGPGLHLQRRLRGLQLGAVLPRAAD